MNEGKSVIYYGGLSENIKQQILSITKMREGSLPVRYLGVPLHHKALTATNYRPLVQKLKLSINNWTGRQLSYAGRLTLVNSVLMSSIRFLGFYICVP